MLSYVSKRARPILARCVSTSTTLPPSLPLHLNPASQSPAPLPAGISPLALLRSQPSHYITALLQGRRYLLTPNDILTIPHLKQVRVGERIALTRILEVGSRDYTLRAAPSEGEKVPRDWQRTPDSLPYLPDGTVKCELEVVEHTRGKMFTVEKFKRRKGYRRTLRSKLEFTRLRVGEIVLGSGEV